MVVKRITEQSKVATIYYLHKERSDTRLESQIEGEVTEWIQWLVEMVQRQDYLGIWGVMDEDGYRIKDYMVAVNAVYPPISRSVMILYQSFFKDTESGVEALTEIKKWAEEKGANKIVIQTDYPRVNSKFGFVKSRGTPMEILL